MMDISQQRPHAQRPQEANPYEEIHEVDEETGEIFVSIKLKPRSPSPSSHAAMAYELDGEDAVEHGARVGHGAPVVLVRVPGLGQQAAEGRLPRLRDRGPRAALDDARRVLFPAVLAERPPGERRVAAAQAPPRVRAGDARGQRDARRG